MSTKCRRQNRDLTTRYGGLEKARKIKVFSSKEISKNCLTRAFPSVIIVKLARAKARKSGPANLENDTERNAQTLRKEVKRRFQEFNAERCLKD